MKKVAVIIFLIFFCKDGISQNKNSYANKEAINIENTIINFLKWHKNGEEDTSKTIYSFTKGAYPDTSTKKVIDMHGVEIYLDHLNRSGYFSESYLNDLRSYFINIDKGLQAAPKQKDLVATPGLGTDWLLDTMEPEMILDHINEGHFDKISIIYNKAMVRFRISKVVQQLYTLTRYNGKWVIDYIGFDNTYQYSLGRE